MQTVGGRKWSNLECRKNKGMRVIEKREDWREERGENERGKVGKTYTAEQEHRKVITQIQLASDCCSTVVILYIWEQFHISNKGQASASVMILPTYSLTYRDSQTTDKWAAFKSHFSFLGDTQSASHYSFPIYLFTYLQLIHLNSIVKAYEVLSHTFHSARLLDARCCPGTHRHVESTVTSAAAIM